VNYKSTKVSTGHYLYRGFNILGGPAFDRTTSYDGLPGSWNVCRDDDVLTTFGTLTMAKRAVDRILSTKPPA
jgi:hypothetical protein